MKALGFGPGSLRVIVLRVLLFGALTAPLYGGARAQLDEELARRPLLVDASSPPPTALVQETLGNLPSTLLAALALAALAWLVIEPWLQATAAALLVPGSQPRRLWRTVWEESWPRLPAVARITFVALAVGGGGVALVVWGTGKLREASEHWEWSGVAQHVTLPMVSTVVIWIWLATVGAFAMHCRVVLMTDRRRFTRRLPRLVAAWWRRAPFRGPLLTVVAQWLVGALGLTLLVRAFPDGSSAGRWLAWSLYLAAQTLVWHGVLRATRHHYAEERFRDLRESVDAPYGLWAAIRRRLRRGAS